MFNIGAGELFIIFLVAFFIVGPEDLPKVIKGLKSALQTVKSLIKDLKAQTGWDDIVKEVSQTKEDVAGTFTTLDIAQDLQDAKKSVEDSVKGLGIRQELEEAKSALEKGVGTLKAGAARQPAGAAAPGGEGGSASAEETKTGSEAEKTEGKSS